MSLLVFAYVRACGFIQGLLIDSCSFLDRVCACMYYTSGIVMTQILYVCSQVFLELSVYEGVGD